jgi:hypothetical protein
VCGHVGNPPYAPYPCRARTPRHQSDRWSLCCAGRSTPVPFVASGPRLVVLIHQPAYCPWRAIGRRSGARRRPCPRPLHACKWHRRDPTYPNRPPPRLVLQNPHKLLSWILDMLWELACLGSVSKNAQSYWRDLFK